MWFRIATTLLVATSCAYALTEQEAAQFSTEGGCAPDAGATGAEISVTYNKGVTTIKANHVPNHAWAQVNANKLKAFFETYTFDSPSNLPDSDVYCLPQGPIGIAKNGVYIFNPTTATGGDAKEDEVMDSQGGVTSSDGAYHYVYLPDNGVVWDSRNPQSQFVGVAFDGNPIYSIGKGVEVADLDICHGTTINGEYRYIASPDHFPYFLGCYRGTPQPTGNQQAPPTKCPVDMANNEACTCESGVISSIKKKRGLLQLVREVSIEDEKETKMSKQGTTHCGTTRISDGDNGPPLQNGNFHSFGNQDWGWGKQDGQPKYRSRRHVGARERKDEAEDTISKRQLLDMLSSLAGGGNKDGGILSSLGGLAGNGGNQGGGILSTLGGLAGNGGNQGGGILSTLGGLAGNGGNQGGGILSTLGKLAGNGGNQGGGILSTLGGLAGSGGNKGNPLSGLFKTKKSFSKQEISDLMNMLQGNSEGETVSKKEMSDLLHALVHLDRENEKGKTKRQLSDLLNSFGGGGNQGNGFSLDGLLGGGGKGKGVMDAVSDLFGNGGGNQGNSIMNGINSVFGNGKNPLSGILDGKNPLKDLFQKELSKKQQLVDLLKALESKKRNAEEEMTGHVGKKRVKRQLGPDSPIRGAIDTITDAINQSPIGSIFGNDDDGLIPPLSGSNPIDGFLAGENNPFSQFLSFLGDPNDPNNPIRGVLGQNNPIGGILRQINPGGGGNNPGGGGNNPFSGIFGGNNRGGGIGGLFRGIFGGNSGSRRQTPQNNNDENDGNDNN